MSQQSNSNQNNPTNQSDRASQLTSAAKKAGPIGEMLHAIASVLPTALGRPLRNFANTLRRTDQAARRIDRARDKLDQQQ